MDASTLTNSCEHLGVEMRAMLSVGGSMTVESTRTRFLVVTCDGSCRILTKGELLGLARISNGNG